MKSFFVRSLLWLMPKRAYTNIIGAIVRRRFSARLIPWYARHFSINLEELAKPLQEHKSLGEFFSRKLSVEARPIANGVVSPVDGEVSSMGKIDRNILLQIKGHTYSLEELLVDAEAAASYADGWYVTLYLSPSDYHRIHAPLDCVARRYRHIPGTLYPVNVHGVSHVQRLFVRNERVVTYFDSAHGSFAMVKVGAAGVGSIVVPFGDLPSGRRRQRGPILDKPCQETFAKGEEVGYFALGSTVVLLFPPSVMLRFVVSPGIKSGWGAPSRKLGGNRFFPFWR